jgi:hippurate hydrolase
MVAAGLVITSLQTIISRQLDPFDHTVISLTKIEGGSAFNVIPDVITIGGTCRTTNNETRDRMLKQIKKVASDAAAIHDCTVEMEIRPGYPPTVNNPEKAEVASNVFESTFGKEKILTDQTPSMGSEDFSYMLQERPGAYIWLGNGEDSENLHSVHYNFNDKLLPIGAHYWATLSETLLANN